MNKYHFLLLKKGKNTESAQLWTQILNSDKSFVLLRRLGDEARILQLAQPRNGQFFYSEIGLEVTL